MGLKLGYCILQPSENVKPRSKNIVIIYLPLCFAETVDNSWDTINKCKFQWKNMNFHIFNDVWTQLFGQETAVKLGPENIWVNTVTREQIWKSNVQRVDLVLNNSDRFEWLGKLKDDRLNYIKQWPCNSCAPNRWIAFKMRQEVNKEHIDSNVIKREVGPTNLISLLVQRNHARQVEHLIQWKNIKIYN